MSGLIEIVVDLYLFILSLRVFRKESFSVHVQNRVIELLSIETNTRYSMLISNRVRETNFSRKVSDSTADKTIALKKKKLWCTNTNFYIFFNRLIIYKLVTCKALLLMSN